MTQRLAAVLIAAATSLLALLLMLADGRWAGPVLFAVSQTHGLHLGDLPVIALWAGVMGLCAWLWVTSAP